MNFQFTHPIYLLALLPALAWVIWLTWKSDVSLGRWRRWMAFALRTVIVLLVIFALAGLQWRKAIEGVNVMFVLDRSDSVPSAQQESAIKYAHSAIDGKKDGDRAGLLVFGANAALEASPNEIVGTDKQQKILAVVNTERTDIGAAVRLATAAFPENGQKRIVLLTDGNENVGNAMSAVLAARPLGVSIDVVPLGVKRGNDLSVQRLGIPGRIKKGQTFEGRIFVQSDHRQAAKLRLYRNDEFMGEQTIELEPGKNLFTFPQTLNDPGFYTYSVQVEAAGDNVPQNNRSTSFSSVRGDPRLLIVSSDPQGDASLAAALNSANLDARIVTVDKFPPTLAELQSYDSVFISNIAAGDLGDTAMKLLESAVRDFGIGLVCIGGDQAYMAGAYKGTPLETTLPVNMELDSKKVLPPGAVVLVMHGMEFANGNQVARDCAQGVLAALSPQDELGVVLWDGNERWLYNLQKVGDKREASRAIAGMNQGDLPAFQGVMTLAYEGLRKSSASLKHMIVFSDGDPGPPSQALMNDIVGAKITVSTVLISGHAGPQTMQWIADQGRGRFHNVVSAADLPQIFIKETMVILKSAIYEEPFKPKFAAQSELVRGISDYPTLLGYVSTQPKPRAEVPLVTHKGDPLLAHWQFGLGRAVAFTSDAKPKWARDWVGGWGQYRQFWSQVAQWSMRRIENADFTSEVTIDKGEGVITVEALDNEGNYRNFLSLQAAVVSPKGERQTIRLEQTGPGHYEARFPTREIGAYLLNLMDVKDGQVRASQVIGASVSYSPEFNATEPNTPLLTRIATDTGGKVLPHDPSTKSDNPFLHDRKKTFQPHDLWQHLLALAILLFPIDVGIRRIQVDREEWRKWMTRLARTLGIGVSRKVETDESLAALLARRDDVRSRHTAPISAKPATSEPSPDLFKPLREPTLPPAAAASEQSSEPSSVESAPPTPGGEQPAKTTSTTSRLLEAKKRAQRKQE